MMEHRNINTNEALCSCCTSIPSCKFCLAQALGSVTEAEGNALPLRIIPFEMHFKNVTVFRTSRIRNAQGLEQ